MTSPTIRRRGLSSSPGKSNGTDVGGSGSRRPGLCYQLLLCKQPGYVTLIMLLLGYAIMLSIHSETVRQELMAVSAAFLPNKDTFFATTRMTRFDVPPPQPTFRDDFPFQDELNVPRNWNFPRWDSNGINFQSLQTFIEAMPSNATTLPWARLYRQFPELLYVLDSQGLHVSTTKRRIITKANQRYRIYPTEEAMRLAHETLRHDKSANWPRLRRALVEGGFPFIVWNGDFLSCNRNNFRNMSIPLFTVCGALRCNHSFPLPTYKTILDSKVMPHDWDRTLLEYERNFTMENKRPKVVWRGSLTGALKNYQSDRARIARFPVDHPSDLLDIGLSSIPERHNRSKVTVDLTYFGGLAKSIKPQERFMNSIGILDIDGNSWSSRFGKLLCYNSVIVKVEPQYIDYFYKSLTPWLHFVPVKHDLSDLLAKAEFVANVSNRPLVRSIVANANHWCRHHLVYPTIATDILDIWEEYLRHLDRGDPNWVKTWNQWKASIMESDGFGMRSMHGRYRILTRLNTRAKPKK